MANSFYNSDRKLILSAIVDQSAFPQSWRSKGKTSYEALVNFVTKNYQNTNKFRQKVCDAVNYISYCVCNNELPAFDWTIVNPIETIPGDYDADIVSDSLGMYYITPDIVDWDDFVPIDRPESNIDIRSIISSDHLYDKTTVFSDGTGIMITPKEQRDNTPDPTDESIPRTGPTDQLIRIIDDTHFEPLTKKEDLWLKRPDVFRFDYKHPAIVQPLEDGSGYFIAPTPLPLVPQRQRDVNAHTDLSLISDEDYMKLYPNHFIRTRKPALYQHIEGIDYDEDFGCIYPIQDFTKEQILDNIIRYPHFFKLRKIIDPELYASTKKWFAGIEPFPVQIELEGELYDTVKIWDSLPESKYIPKQKDFIVDYVIRRYLLEEEAGIEHKYKLHGRLDPFITLFMPPEMYVERGYGDPLQIVKKCVKARRDFFRSINPALKRFGIPVDYDEN